ncbi:hypothetical protein [Bradyrhizobium pachyrhizi]|uniref:hypothetical protein n=1 Tax=Bradyrhizobium pachyrhizi TaxID=280333 RepID=UPI003D35BE67
MLTIASLVDEYLVDPDSRFLDLSHRVRENNRRYLARIKAEKGEMRTSEITPRMLLYWYKNWSRNGQVSSARVFLSQLRAIFYYGFAYKRDAHCMDLKLALDNTKYKAVPERTSRLTAEHARAIIEKAHEWGVHSIALAQAFQYELMLKQKDVIGEYIPTSEFVGQTGVIWKGQSWTAGLRWNEIDEDYILRHRTCGRERWIEVDLKQSPVIMTELEYWTDHHEEAPVVICEATAMPWNASEYRRKWRLIADCAGVPANVKNMDSRAGAKIVNIAGRNYREFERKRPGQRDHGAPV